ncbi:hypothetical protein RmaAA213_11810 [Rhodothermus marinus]|nr:hypothetical protein RmaAA213_11810 [Rhodothermus marinus]
MWLSTIAERACALMGKRYIYFYKSTRFGQDFVEFYRRTSYEVLSCANAEIHEVRQINGFRGVHVVRDPRDVIVSG